MSSDFPHPYTDRNIRGGGKLDTYDFGPSVNTGEPIFAADLEEGRDQGWLITQTLDVERGTSGFAVEVGETMRLSLLGHWVVAPRASPIAPSSLPVGV
jgi:hypothetical protein